MIAAAWDVLIRFGETERGWEIGLTGWGWLALAFIIGGLAR